MSKSNPDSGQTFSEFFMECMWEEFNVKAKAPDQFNGPGNGLQFQLDGRALRIQATDFKLLDMMLDAFQKELDSAFKTDEAEAALPKFINELWNMYDPNPDPVEKGEKLTRWTIEYDHRSFIDVKCFHNTFQGYDTIGLRVAVLSGEE